MLTRLVTDLTNLNLGDVLFSATFGVMIYLVGGADEAIKGLLLFMLFDYITGLAKAYRKRNLNKNKIIYGLMKKMTILIIIAMGNRIDIIFHLTSSLLNCKFVTTAFYIGSEGLSVLENATAIGVPVPAKLKKILEHCQNEELEKIK